MQIHQQSASSSDVSFNLSFTGTGFDRTELAARLMSNRVELAWPFFPTGFSLEFAPTTSTISAWQSETNSITVTNGENTVILEPRPDVSRFYRLRRL